jgi:DNA-binding Lrp family transcriptional regulator
MADDPRELTLYVQSKKAVTTFYRPAPSAASGMHPSSVVSASQPSIAAGPSTMGESSAVGDDSGVYFLSDDQSRCAALVEELAAHRGYKVRLVDIEKVGRLERLVTEHLRGVQTFPVLVSPSGQRLQGVEQFTEENLAAFMPTELRSVRAMSYLKIRGGDMDHIRKMLEGLPEVKELHFLTGDWDILVVLEFPPSSGNKRRVLDFVTERIRGIPQVLDTSTVVPEFSVTKFPTSG